MIGPEQVVSDHRREMRRTGIVWLVLALVLAMTLGFAYRTDRRADHSDKELSSSTSRVETLKGQVQANGQLAQSAKDAADEANRRLIAAGKQPVPVPTVTPISPSPSAEGVTVAEVRAIVAVEIAKTPAKLTQTEITQVARIAAALVPKPADGKTPTAAELRPIVAAVLAAYCVDDKCVGKPGDKGEKGDKGDPGQDAPKVTDAELLAAAKQTLATYCAQDSQPCKGPQGDPGQSVTGPTGPAGRGIADTDCQDDGTWLIYYTDGTTDTARGPCRIVIPPTKQPEN